MAFDLELPLFAWCERGNEQGNPGLRSDTGLSMERDLAATILILLVF
jgi:hypothetical protein